jgi:hypothetical protein
LIRVFFFDQSNCTSDKTLHLGGFGFVSFPGYPDSNNH